MKTIPAIIIAIVLLSGCNRPPQVARTDTVKITTTKEVIRDTTVYLTDSSGLYALLFCDSLGQARIRQIEQFYAGQWVKPKVVIKDNYLSVDCKIDSAAVMIKWNETHTTQTTSTTQVVVKEVNYVKGYQWFFIYVGGIALVGGILYAVYSLIASKWWVVILSFILGQAKKLFKKD